MAEFSNVVFGYAGLRPLQRQQLKFYAESVELTNLIRRELRHVGAGVGHTPHKSLALKRNQRLPHHGSANFHLPRQLPLHNSVARLELAGKESVFEGVDDSIAQ